MASPQCENGYTKIANEILEQLSRIKLNGYEFRILMLLFRYTYGWSGRKDAYMSGKFFSQGTGIDRRHIQQVLKILREKKIITCTENCAGRTAKYRFNKNYEEWRPAHNNVQRTEKGAAPAPNTAPEPAPNSAHNKEKRNIYKERANNFLTDEQKIIEGSKLAAERLARYKAKFKIKN